MKKINKKALLATALGATVATGVSAADLESRVEALEYQSYENIVKFSGELENRVDVINNENKGTTAFPKSTASGKAATLFSMWFNLDVEATPTNGLTFYGRLAMAKYFNEATSRGTVPGRGDFDTYRQGTQRETSALYVERAFVNYNITDSLIFTAGRLPTIEGGPKHHTYMSSSLGSYPALAYSAILDGLALTYAADVFGGNLSTRFVYTPLQFIDRTSGNSISEAKDANGNEIDENHTMYAAMLDYTLDNAGFTRYMNIVLQYTKFDNHYVDQNLCLDGSNNPLTFSRISVECSASSYEYPISSAEFSIERWMLYTEFSGLFGTGLDLAFSYSMTDTKSKGYLTGAASGLGIFTNAASAKNDGNVLLVSAGYNIMNRFRLGYEYIDIDPKAFALDLVAKDPLVFYGTNGSKGHHVYLGAKLNDYAKVILGYMTQEQKKLYTTTIFGNGTDVNFNNSAVYTRFIANF